MRIEPPADDYGTQSLRRSNAAGGAVKATGRIARYPAIPTSLERRKPVQPPPMRLYDGPERRGGGDRRQRERRRRDVPVLLDTRSHHERRRRLRRESDRAEAERRPPRESAPASRPRRGIDVEV